ncbi:hypothetical protein [Janthinobacterium sp. PSPC3-1]|uniref:hypothetical protein n=1 Tax=Janthinobacterium sp. PSPC3-1 TaxID=2804653 RepID=UPI003CF9BF6D
MMILNEFLHQSAIMTSVYHGHLNDDGAKQALTPADHLKSTIRQQQSRGGERGQPPRRWPVIAYAAAICLIEFTALFRQ